MFRLAERQDLDRIMEIWLEGNLQAHDFVDPAYWTGCLQEVREAIARADVWVWDENGRVEPLPVWWSITLQGCLYPARSAERESVVCSWNISKSSVSL